MCFVSVRICLTDHVIVKIIFKAYCVFISVCLAYIVTKSIVFINNRIQASFSNCFFTAILRIFISNIKLAEACIRGLSNNLRGEPVKIIIFIPLSLIVFFFTDKISAIVIRKICCVSKRICLCFYSAVIVPGILIKRIFLS